MMFVNSSFLSGVHAHIAREQMLTRHAMLLSVLIIRVSCVFSQEQFTMSKDPWCGLESATRLGWSESLISSRCESRRVSSKNCFEFVNFCESVDEALPRICCSRQVVVRCWPPRQEECLSHTPSTCHTCFQRSAC